MGNCASGVAIVVQAMFNGTMSPESKDVAKEKLISEAKEMFDLAEAASQQSLRELRHASRALRDLHAKVNGRPTDVERTIYKDLRAARIRALTSCNNAFAFLNYSRDQHAEKKQLITQLHFTEYHHSMEKLTKQLTGSTGLSQRRYAALMKTIETSQDSLEDRQNDMNDVMAESNQRHEEVENTVDADEIDDFFKQPFEYHCPANEEEEYTHVDPEKDLHREQHNSNVIESHQQLDPFFLRQLSVPLLHAPPVPLHNTNNNDHHNDNRHGRPPAPPASEVLLVQTNKLKTTKQIANNTESWGDAGYEIPLT